MRRKPYQPKPKITRLVFWQSLNSHHHAPYLERLNSLGRYEVHWAVERDVASSSRSGMGWPDTSGSLPVHIAPNDEGIDALLNDRRAESLHIFTGIHGQPMVQRAHRHAVRLNARLALLNEPPIPNQLYQAMYGGSLLKAAMRPMIHKAHQLIHGWRVEAVWAIGHMAVDWYRYLGYPEDRIFPWAYFPPGPDAPLFAPPRIGPSLKLLYLGQVNIRKGLDVLIDALGQTQDGDWHLRVIGSGPLLESCKELARKHRIDSKAEWFDFTPHQEAMVFVQESDVVVVPSRHDGWGAVVNEALARGIPVICTDRCGSADLMHNSLCGTIVRANDPVALLDAIVKCLPRVLPLRESRAGILAWADRISPKSGADYFDRTVRYLNDGGDKPTAPWAS